MEMLRVNGKERQKSLGFLTQTEIKTGKLKSSGFLMQMESGSDFPKLKD